MYSYRIEQAIKAASVLHQGQVRKGPVAVPYISHLMAVSFLVADFTDIENIVIGALLHDTLEDTDYTAEELREDFGEEVHDIVLALSEPQNSNEKTYTWLEQKEQYYQQLTTAPTEALMIAAADKIHNLRSIIEDYYDDYEAFEADFRGTLEQQVAMYERIAALLVEQLDNAIVDELVHVLDEYKKFISDVKNT